MTVPAAAGRSRRHRGRTLSGLAALVIGMLLLLPAPAASAHAFLAGSNPADGATLSSAPTEFRMDFSESVVLDALEVDIVDSHGRHYRPTGLHLVSAAAASTEEPAEIIGELPPLAHDAYRISWQTLSSDDLHRTNGVLVFGIGQSVTAAGSVEPAPRVDEVLLRAAIFLSLSLSLGGLLAARLLRRSRWGTAAMSAERCRRWARWGSLAGIACAVGLLADQVSVGGISFSAAIASSYGTHFITRVIGFVLLLIATAGSPSMSRGPRVALISVGGTGVGIATALMGHSGAGLVVSTTRVAADAVHLLAAATWSGTLFLVVGVALPAARRSAADAVRAMLRGFGVPAGICVAVMLVSGVYLASSVVGSVDALLLTWYGRTLIVKLGVIVIVCGLGLVNTRRLHRVAAQRLPVGTVLLEAAAAAVVLVLAAMLTSSQPALDPKFVASPAAVPVRDGAAGDLQQSVAVRPNLPGKNVILIGVFDTRKPALAPIREVSVKLVGPDGRAVPSFEATSLGDRQWSVTTDIGWTNHYSIRVTVKRPGLADETSSYPWIVAAPLGQIRSVTVSNAPIESALQTTSLILLVMVLAGAVAVMAVRRRLPGEPPEEAEISPARAEMADAAK